MYSKRISTLAIAFGCLGLLLFAGICYRMVIQGDKLSNTPFTQQTELDRIKTLAEQGIISRDEQGKVRVDYQALEQRYGKRFTGFVKKRQQFLAYSDKGELQIRPEAVTVGNPHKTGTAGLARRGRILDTRGRVLAESRERKTGHWYRAYPYGRAALPLVGSVHPIFGERGLEKQLSGWLTGREKTGAATGMYRLLSGREKQGDVYLTIDAEVQKAAFAALGSRTGAIVVLDVRTGAIVAAASTPSFDPATAARADWEAAAAKGYQGPFINRGLQRRYPPGSTFKIITATAVIDKKGFNAKKARFLCKGTHPKYHIHDYHNKKHGWVDLKAAFKLSCNVFFGEAGVRLGPELLRKAEQFGFNHPWNLIGRGTGHQAAKSLAFAGISSVQGGGVWQPADFVHNPRLVAQGGIGQNVISATPLQMALAGAAIANKGVLMRPYLVDRVSLPVRTGLPKGSSTGGITGPGNFPGFAARNMPNRCCG